MKKTKNICKICLNSGRFFNGEEYEQCPNNCIDERLEAKEIEKDWKIDELQDEYDFPFEDEFPNDEINSLDRDD